MEQKNSSEWVSLSVSLSVCVSVSLPISVSLSLPALLGNMASH